MEDWLINYYEQTDPLKRQQMLLENKNETMSEEDKLRMKLWETRYGKGKPRKDMFVGYLMNLKYIVESGSMDLGGRKKKLAIEAILGLNLYEFERKPKTQQEIIFLRGTTLIISKKPGNTGISRDIRTEFTTDLLLSD